MNGKQKYYYCHYPMWSQELNILWGVRHHLAKARTSKVIGLKYQNIHAILVFWELWNLVDGLQYKIESLSDEEFNAIINKTYIHSYIQFMLLFIR